MTESNNHFAFYQNLTPFSDFAEISKPQHFHKVPSDWTLVLSDIRGSTKAIQRGDYKKVNLIGAATITAYINVAHTSDIPFVFGGDGATLLAPQSVVPALLNELRRLKRLAKEEFQMELRVAAVPIATLNQLEQEVLVAKLQLSPGNFLAQFRGGGLTSAETLLKSNDPRIQIIESADDNLYHSLTHPLKGLSCRLNPLRSRRGRMITVLCKPKGDQTQQNETLKEVVDRLAALLDSNLSKATPVNEQNVSWPLIPKSVGTEARLQIGGGYWVRWLTAGVMSLIANLSLNFDFALGSFKPQKYKSELPLNSDSKKFDETLRMVLDCSPEEGLAIRQTLESMHQENKLTFGIHESADALMTCIAYDPSNNGHIHFIDGADGGYAMAAVQLKQQG